MALKLSVLHKGEYAEYFRITESREDYVDNSTRVVLGLYRNKDVRDAGVDNILDKKVIVVEGIDHTRESLYTAIVQPKPILLTPEVEEILEVVENGVVIRPYQAPVAATYKESNIFVKAVSV